MILVFFFLFFSTESLDADFGFSVLTTGRNEACEFDFDSGDIAEEEMKAQVLRFGRCRERSREFGF